jgi:hypothetical protein
MAIAVSKSFHGNDILVSNALAGEKPTIAVITDMTTLSKKHSLTHYFPTSTHRTIIIILTELEKFLIATREEYLSYSARNYTVEQKEYNNRLTAHVRDLAVKYGYTDLADPEQYSFSTVRDKIRCYFKSYVQSSKRRGDGSPLDAYYEQHRREQQVLQQSANKNSHSNKNKSSLKKKALTASDVSAAARSRGDRPRNGSTHDGGSIRSIPKKATGAMTYSSPKQHVALPTYSTHRETHTTR